MNKTRTVTLEGKEYTRTASDLFATDKDFKNLVEPSQDFKDTAAGLWIKQCKYILWQDIIDSDTKENLKLNWKIIKSIVKEQYNDNWFEFIKDSGLVKLDWDKIAKSELASYRNSDGHWEPDGLGSYSCVWLRALDSAGHLVCIDFGEDSADWCCHLPGTAMRIAWQNKQDNLGKTIYDYSDRECLWDSWTIVAVDIYDRYIIKFDNLPDQVFVFEELQEDNIDIRFEKEVIPQRVDNFMNEISGKWVWDIRYILLKYLRKNS